MPKEIRKKKRPSKSSSQSKRKGPSKKPRKKRDKVENEISAGGIVFRKTPRSIQFAIMKDSYNKWAFPKGHVEEGESREEAAARETLEELGLDEIRLHEYLGKIDIWFRDRFDKPGVLIHKDIHYFLFSAPSDAVLRPDPAEHVYAAKWVSPSQLVKMSSYSDMTPILEKALSLVRPNRKEKRGK